MNELIENVKLHVQEIFQNDATGHDWFHIERVHAMACQLQEKQGGNRLVIELSALLHDISDHKMNGGKLNHGGTVAFELLKKLNCTTEIALAVKEIVDGVSYKGANVPDEMTSLEGKIVQDADRLDAIGAIGIARTFAFGGNKNRAIYLPDLKPIMHASFEEYATAKSHTINHFYEKLLLIKNRLHTKAAIEVGNERHHFMENFLQQFFKEWHIINH